MYTYLKFDPIHNLRVFSPREFQRLLQLSPVKAKYILETYCKKGTFVRLKKGLYASKDNYPSQAEIANRLYQPSYISFEYAMQLHGLIPESAYTITSATTKPTRTFVVDGVPYSFSSLHKSLFNGYFPSKQNGVSVLLAEPEKALADYLYLVTLGKKAPLERLSIDKLDKTKLTFYEKIFDRPLLRLI